MARPALPLARGGAWRGRLIFAIGKATLYTRPVEKIAAILVTVLTLAAMAASVAMFARYTMEGRINVSALLIITTAAALLAGLLVMMANR